MTRWLILSLTAPMAGQGELAGFERRGLANRPTKSQVLGLIGAGLGLTRDDADAQRALSDGYRVAFRLARHSADSPFRRRLGTVMQDYHTVETVAGRRGFHPRTRAHALAEGEVHTMITRRDYVCDVITDAAVCANEGARWPLEDVAEALKTPHFTLYFGRKSCPFTLPVNPRVVEAGDALDAFRAGDAAESEAARALRRDYRLTAEPADLAADVDDPAMRKTNAAPRRHRRRDHPTDRIKWHFTSRQEAVIGWPGAPAHDSGEGEG
jgi:CRISPR system Cascade subunit CasD